MFDINEGFRSIDKRKAVMAIRFTKPYISITNKDIEAIFHARKSILYYNDELLVKKGGRNFHVTMDE